MKKLIFVLVFMSLIILPCLAQSDADKEVARTQEFVAASIKKGAEKIGALKAYIQKFPETSSKWTVLAYYNVAMESLLLNDCSQAVQYGEKALKMELGDAEHGRLLLILANAYGNKKGSVFNLDKGNDYVDKTISFAETKNLDDVLNEARKLKAQLAGPPPKKMTPEQQIKYSFSLSDYNAVISYYQQLPASDKANEEIHKTYANSLFKADKYDAALNEFQALNNKGKKAIYASKIAEIYGIKAKRNKALVDNVIDAYLDASILYSKEGSSANAKTCMDTARYQLYEKYGTNDRIKKYNATVGTEQNSSKKNEVEIARLEKDLRKEQRRLRKEYESQDIEAPQYELDKIKKLEKKIEALKSGASSSSAAPKNDESKKLEEELKRVNQEFEDLVAKAKKRMGM